MHCYCKKVLSWVISMIFQVLTPQCLSYVKKIVPEITKYRYIQKVLGCVIGVLNILTSITKFDSKSSSLVKVMP